MTCYEFDDGLTVCTPGPVRVLSTVDMGEKWCFICRKRQSFTDTCSTDDNPWYEPWWTVRCARGHVDGDLFPGWSREASE